MITATIIGQVVNVRSVSDERFAVRFRTSYRQYDRNSQSVEWRTIFSTAFVPSSYAQNLAQGDSITLIADIAPEVYNDEATIRVLRVHRLIRNHYRSQESPSPSDPVQTEDLLDENYDPFAED